MEPSDYFVGRTEHCDKILKGPRGQGAFYAIPGIRGSGKSWLLRELQARAVAEGDRAALVSMDDHLRAAETTTDADDPYAELRGFCEALATILADLAAGPQHHTAIDEAMAVVEGKAKTLRPSTGYLPATMPSGGSGIGSQRAYAYIEALPTGPQAEPYARKQARELIELVCRAGERLARDRASEDKRVYLLVDAFEVVMDRPLGGWFLDLLKGLPSMVVVVTYREDYRDRPAISESATILPLTGLGPAEVSAYLTFKFGPDAESIVGSVVAFTDGHAQAVALTSDLVRDNGGPDASGTLVRQLAAFEADPLRKLGELVKRILKVVDDPEVSAGLSALWVVRRFDVELLAHLLDIDEDRAEALSKKLAEYSFVEAHDETAAVGAHSSIHRFIRDYGSLQLRSLNPTRYYALHQRAEAYYQEKATDYPTSYEAWFDRYEDERSQNNEREWLYHVAHLPADRRASGRLGMARLFFDTFWWWGNYVRFPFTEKLLADWAEMASAHGDEDDRALGEDLHRVYDLYPKGWREKDKADWNGVRRSLIHIRDRGQLGSVNGPSPPDKVARHVRGIVDIYLADAYRYVKPTDPRVVAVLADAREQFAANGDDDWDIAWLPFQEAEAAMGREDHDEALALVDDLVAEWGDLDDRELMANLHRVHADVAWANGDADLALDCHARAVLHAYHFQAKEVVDKYTQTFLIEMRDRAMDRLAELHDAGQAETVRSACARIRAFYDWYWQITEAPEPPDFEGLLAQGRVEEATEHLFPAPPDLSDLDKRGTDYELLVGDFIDNMYERLAEPPGTPLPRG